MSGDLFENVPMQKLLSTQPNGMYVGLQGSMNEVCYGPCDSAEMQDMLCLFK